ncbi:MULTISPECIES: hypothetical protein [Curvivirga]|uniref:hypothetical protein n=1 Tax=Curvivirga TaxID=2856846 RepID=UPI0012BCE250|nr:hypothetical protein [Curvivirga aplysinae]MTI09726.1 hypothetical protein [Curvivirga aplysinae]
MSNLPEKHKPRSNQLLIMEGERIRLLGKKLMNQHPDIISRNEVLACKDDLRNHMHKLKERQTKIRTNILRQTKRKLALAAYHRASK